MNKSLSVKIFLCFISGLFLNVSGLAEEKPEIRFENTMNSLLDVLSELNDEMTYTEKNDKVLAVFQENNFDFDTIIRRTLGRNWTQLNEEQKEQTKQLIMTMLLKAYTEEFRDAERPEMNFGKAVFLNPKKSKLEIPSTIEVRGTTVNLSYRLANRPEIGWQVYDILLEGVSMVNNYRKQIDDHFRNKNTAEDLINLLKSKMNS